MVQFPDQHQNKVLTDFETGQPDQWQAEQNSSFEVTEHAARSGKYGLQWILHADGENAYGNAVSHVVDSQDWSNYDSLHLDFYSAEPVPGRIGCQITAGGKELTLADINPQVEQGVWKTVRIGLPASDLKSVTSLKFFCYALSFPAGDHVFYLDNIRLSMPQSEAKPTGKPLPSFFTLSTTGQKTVRSAVTPPPLGERRAPYSVPMYYPQWGGGTPDGKLHADWQETLIKDWAELGLTKLHFYLYPNGSGTAHRTYTVDASNRTGIQVFAKLCEKYHMKIGLRVELPYDLDAKTQVADFWPAHPNNAQNELKPYLIWLSTMVKLMKGRLEYCILGDEMNWTTKGDGRDWNAAVYMQFFKQAANVVHAADPAVKVCMYSAESGRWNEVVELIKNGYADYGDAVAINHYDYQVLKGYIDQLKELVPQKKMLFLSNGVGYISSDTPLRSPETDPYSRYNDNDQASMIARTMYTWWALGADVAPYYVCMRNVVYHGEVRPQWYGFFGFEDLVIDNNDKASVKHYPGWYTYKTIATVFNDRPAYTDPAFSVTSDNPTTTYLRAYVRRDNELVLILWSDEPKPQRTNIHVASTAFTYPVQLDIMDSNHWMDVPATQDSTGKGITLWNITLSKSPTVIRMIRPRVLKPDGK